MEIIGDTKYQLFMSFFISTPKNTSASKTRFDTTEDGEPDFKNMFVKNPPIPPKEWKYKLAGSASRLPAMAFFL